jgi:hypothetical protein
MSSVGPGIYSAILGLPIEEAQRSYWNRHYVVTIRADFKWYYKGHPEMAAYREWVAGIVDVLTHAFDEERLWRQTIDDYTLRQHLPAPSGLAPTPGPVRSVPRETPNRRVERSRR